MPDFYGILMRDDGNYVMENEILTSQGAAGHFPGTLTPPQVYSTFNFRLDGEDKKIVFEG